MTGRADGILIPRLRKAATLYAIPMSIKLLIAFFAFFFCQQASAQKLTSYSCDKSILSEEEYEKCVADSLWEKDLLIVSDYITFLQKKIFPEFRIKRKKITISAQLELDLASLRKIYDSTLDSKLSAIKKDMYRNQKFIQPNAYLSSLMSLEIFNFYPDINAILLNPIHLELNPKTELSELETIEKLVSKLLLSIPSDLYTKADSYSKALETKKNEYPHQIGMFKGDIDVAQREKLNILNFLLWIK